MTGPISPNRLIGSLNEAASWPGAHPSTVVILATALVSARADAEGSSYLPGPLRFLGAEDLVATPDALTLQDR